MKVAIVYLHVSKSGYPGAPPPEHYLPFEERFVRTYRDFDSGFGHHLRVVCCGGGPDAETRKMYSGVADSFSEYLGAGSDLGAQQDALPSLDADFVVNMATPVNFWRSGWLKRIVEAREKHGDGLYGPFASNLIQPHIRTSCWAVDKATFLRYPHAINTRSLCYSAEHADCSPRLWQFSYWYCSLGKPTMMVTWDGEYGPLDWRKPNNIMFRGDQSNCLMHDRYTRYYEMETLATQCAMDAMIT